MHLNAGALVRIPSWWRGRGRAQSLRSGANTTQDGQSKDPQWATAAADGVHGGAVSLGRGTAWTRQLGDTEKGASWDESRRLSGLVTAGAADAGLGFSIFQHVVRETDGDQGQASACAGLSSIGRLGSSLRSKSTGDMVEAAV